MTETELTQTDKKRGNFVLGLINTIIFQIEDEYLVGIQAISRVQIETIFTDEGRFYATYTPISDIQDIENISNFELMAEIKKTIHEIITNFKGSDQFTVPADQMESIDQIIGFTMPYIPISLEIKQIYMGNSLSPATIPHVPRNTGRV